MFNPAEALRDNPALFACYVLFVYFRGRNAVRIERERRELGHTTFHRRNLYPRGRQPGWIARYRWSDSLTAEPPFANGRQETGDERHFLDQSPVSSLPSPDFSSWLKRVAPNMTWDWKHQQVIIKQLEKVTTGDCKRLMIFLPPRHGKTELVSVKYTAWRMQLRPELNVILGSYNQRLADRMSRKIRTSICDAEAIRLGRTQRHRSVTPVAAGTFENSPPYEGGVDAALGGRGGSLCVDRQATFNNGINSTDHSQEGRSTPALLPTQDPSSSSEDSSAPTHSQLSTSSVPHPPAARYSNANGSSRSSTSPRPASNGNAATTSPYLPRPNPTTPPASASPSMTRPAISTSPAVIADASSSPNSAATSSTA